MYVGVCGREGECVGRVYVYLYVYVYVCVCVCVYVCVCVLKCFRSVHNSNEGRGLDPHDRLRSCAPDHREECI